LLSHPDSPILIDEVDNGLHPRLVETLLQLLAGRQSFLASHNKIVIDYTNFDGPEDVRRKIHIVQRAKDGRQSVLVLDDETARAVYDKIEVAIQSPSDVLLAEGLW
ncbi:MAG TPA: AAA family ATPase, partial [Nannocystis sp.]